VIYGFNVGAGSKPAPVDSGITYQPAKSRGRFGTCPYKASYLRRLRLWRGRNKWISKDLLLR